MGTSHALAEKPEQALPTRAEDDRHDTKRKPAFGPAVAAARDDGVLRRLAVRSVAAFIAHELNHPLGTIANLAALLSRRIDEPVVRPSELRAQIDAIKHENRRAADVVRDLGLMAGGLHGHSESVNLYALLREAVTRLRRRYGKDVVSVRVECTDRSLRLQAVPGLLHIALYNLLTNSVEALQAASSSRPRLILRANRMPDDRAAIDVIDNGPGVDEAIAERMFEPFVSSKRGGSGFGLAICRDVVEWHGGALTYEDVPKRGGACFRVALPTE